jgi:hypothetical protein
MANSFVNGSATTEINVSAAVASAEVLSELARHLIARAREFVEVHDLVRLEIGLGFLAGESLGPAYAILSQAKLATSKG